MLVVIWLLCGIIGLMIGEKKNRAGQGLALGILLGLIGVIIISVLEPRKENT
jgi:uncharacterized membrane protein YeaQ/YmgE (transglycosylase-associated protein family)